MSTRLKKCLAQFSMLKRCLKKKLFSQADWIQTKFWQGPENKFLNFHDIFEDQRTNNAQLYREPLKKTNFISTADFDVFFNHKDLKVNIWFY